MNTHELLRANCEKLWNLYKTNLDDLKALQSTLVDDILPHLAFELELDDQHVIWATEWLEDTTSMFHMLRRHSFTRSHAMESIRKGLVWRLDHLKPILKFVDADPSSSHEYLARCLPNDMRDPFGRPILVVRAVDFECSSTSEADVLKSRVLAQMEALRLHLADVAKVQKERPPTLQFVILLDLAGVSVQKANLELLSWVMRDVIPRYPGQLAAVFMLHYTWTLSGIWSLIKRLLPSQALSRVFFADEGELREYFTMNSLPQEYGGTVPLDSMENPLMSLAPAPQDTHTSSRTSKSHPSGDGPVRQAIGRDDTWNSPLSARSFMNPFFGYPVLLTPASPSLTSSSYAFPQSAEEKPWQSHLRHGRRRKRDLAQTLLRLFWDRWKTRTPKIASIVLLVALFFSLRRKAHIATLFQRLGKLRTGPLTFGRFFQTSQ
ncbi:CRAL-TRIO domain-containing protein [Pterulicium gracile]|uniref:CRAL-TRIO domain-containing protein n=1 Tax=Pterulicium gracile TaxID=1884261 RepID=A0A5C3QM55_9AGAR|nr:CRAL-TRIO domain-containing protein [Pterula gracilis]